MPGSQGGAYVRLEGGVIVNEDTVHTARETAGHSVDLPNWTNAPEFKNDVFTFARIVFKNRVGGLSFGGRGFGGFRGGWYIDYPDADLNLSFRLQWLTSMKVDPDTRVLKLTSPDLSHYPFIFMEHVEAMLLSNQEVTILRNYLLNGGSLMINDTWGDGPWENFEGQMKRVLPDNDWVELTMDHPIFHSIFDLSGPMSNLQMPTIQFWNRSYNPYLPWDSETNPTSGRERYAEQMHVRAWLDKNGHIMVIAIHNSDMPDGWEREAENQEYFQLFSETRSYPLMINILYYLMTH